MDRRVVAVVVTYHPGTEVGHLLDALVPQVDGVVVVDNGSSAETVAALEVTLGPRGTLLALGENLGVAAAQNRGIDQARADGATHVLLFDDDSDPAPDMVARLLAALDADATGRLGAVGPVPVDPRTGEAPLVFTDQGSGPRRIPALPTTPGTVVEVAFLVASGCLVDLRVVDEVGAMDKALFIDHVDLEWGLRARRHGWRLGVVVGAVLTHSLGETTRRVLWRSRDVHIQHPLRNYYTVRNTIWLVRTKVMPPRWRLGYLAWITRYIVYYLLAVPPRRTRVPLMAAGLRDALRGRLGPLPQ
ncbi:MAG: glycosyltransferase family 2 protein [Micrococcales bacterium]|nr:glycosyltransferase family 2 protein [Micrococcales bacterium]